MLCRKRTYTLRNRRLNKNINTKREWAGLFFILPSFIGVSVFLLVPFLDVIRRSFTGAISGEWVGLQNYKEVLENSAFQQATVNTLRFVGICIPVLILISLFLAVFLQKQGRYGKNIKSAFLIPMAIPVASVVLLWRLLFHPNGFLNGFLQVFGIQGADWMNTEAAFWVLVFSYLWKNIGYDIVLWMAGLSGISESIYEAAKVDGAGPWKCFTKITIPCLMPSFYTIAVLSFLNSFKVFREAYLVAGDYPNKSMYLLQHLFNNWYRDLSLDKMAAGAVLHGLSIFVLVMMMQKFWEVKE